MGFEPPRIRFAAQQMPIREGHAVRAPSRHEPLDVLRRLGDAAHQLAHRELAALSCVTPLPPSPFAARSST